MPSYVINWESQPLNFENMIARLQEAYLRTSDQTPRKLHQTLVHLKNLAISHQLFPPDHTTELDALVFSTLNLEPLHRLFSDPEVTEVFGNTLGGELIITHLAKGRCVTNILFTKEFWDSLKIRAEYDTGLPLNSNNPALKLGLTSNLGHLRISMQVSPLSTLGPTLSIRRLPSSPLTLEKLVKEKQVPSKIAVTLSEAIKNRENIIIAGEPGSGKTTLANALLLMAEPSWRLIILEDAREISLDTDKFPLLVHYALPAVGRSNRIAQRSNEIARLLHRSPDYLFLGEIQNKDDTTVAFEGFAAGLRGMATTHAKDAAGLFKRWTLSHHLPPDLIDSIDWIVITSRELVDGRSTLGIKGLYSRKNGELVMVFES